MSTIRTLLRATTVAMGSSTALLVGGLMATAHADPAQPVPAPNSGDQAAASNVDPNQVLRHIAMALAAQQPAPQPATGAAIRMPQPAPAAFPNGTTSVAGPNPFVPGAATAGPAATTVAPGTGSTGLVPSAQVDLPQLPFLPVPLPQQMSLPGDLTSLMPGAAPAPRSTVPPSTAVATVPANAPATSSNPVLVPLSALP
jgi:hypothetical protein